MKMFEVFYNCWKMHKKVKTIYFFLSYIKLFQWKLSEFFFNFLAWHLTFSFMYEQYD